MPLDSKPNQQVNKKQEVKSIREKIAERGNKVKVSEVLSRVKPPVVGSTKKEEPKKIKDFPLLVTKPFEGGLKKKNEERDTDTEVHQKFRRRFQARISTIFLDTGNIGCNNVLGGGFPAGKISEWCSPSGLGKSTIALSSAKNLCKAGHTVVYVDSEFAVNGSLVDGVGLTPYLDKNFFLYQMRTYSEIEDLFDSYLSCTRPPSVIVVDSITAVMPKKIIEGSLKIEDVEPGLHSRILSQFMLKYKGTISLTNTHLMIISQQRIKINMRGPSLVDSAGGNSLKFYPDIRLRVSKKSEIKVGTEVIGVDAYVEAIKNKFTSPYVKHLICVMFGKGVSNLRACTFFLEKEKVVKQAGSSFLVTLPGLTESVRGRIGLETLLRNNEPVVTKFLKSKGYL